MSETTRILFVCLGNIVRSPLAENLFRHQAREAGLEGKYQADSAGTSGWHVGEPPDPRMRQVAARYGFEYSGRARQVKADDFEKFDWIIAMDSSNRTALQKMAKNQAQKGKIRLLREFDAHADPEDPVPDPYYGGIDGFEEVFRIVQRSTRGLLEALERGELG